VRNHEFAQIGGNVGGKRDKADQQRIAIATAVGDEKRRCMPATTIDREMRIAALAPPVERPLVAGFAVAQLKRRHFIVRVEPQVKILFLAGEPAPPTLAGYLPDAGNFL